MMLANAQQKGILIKNNQQGFSAIEALLLFIIVGLIGSTGWAVWHARQAADKSLSAAASSTPATQTKLSAKADTASPLTTTTTPAASSSAPSTSKATSTKSKTTTTNTTSQAPAASPTPAPTALSVLTGIITDLEKGTSAKVTANSVTVPGPISDAQARPIVFTLNGQTYFAYTQGTPPNFNISPSQTAGSMAIVKATVSSPALIDAYLDKTNNLTDSNFHADGYSTGGN